MAGDEGPTTEELRQLVASAREQAFASSDAMHRLAAVLRLRCEECGRGWSDPGERWRAYRAERGRRQTLPTRLHVARYEREVDDEAPAVVLLCEECASSGGEW